jgi:hypothetical protein
MYKKVLMTMMALVLSVSTFAQFEKEKLYANASISGMNMSYSGADKWKFDLGSKLGYMIEDNWLATALVDFSCRNNDTNMLTFGLGGRYYVQENGLFVGAGLNYRHVSVGGDAINDLMPTVQIGYVFFLNKTVTFEPEFYYNQSFKDHSQYSEVGVRLSLGIYLDNF